LTKSPCLILKSMWSKSPRLVYIIQLIIARKSCGAAFWQMLLVDSDKVLDRVANREHSSDKED
jgi:hypothetical protein